MMRKRNHEGYYDPAAWDAIVRVDKGRKWCQRAKYKVAGL